MPTIFPKEVQRAFRLVDDAIIPFTGHRAILYPYVGDLDLNHDGDALDAIQEIHAEADISEDQRFLSPVKTEIDFEWPDELVKTEQVRLDLTERSEDPVQIEPIRFRPSDLVTENSYFKVSFTFLDPESDRDNVDLLGASSEKQTIVRISVNEVLSGGATVENITEAVGGIKYSDDGKLHPDDDSHEAHIPTDSNGNLLIHENGVWPSTLNELQS